jgi:hypothetical protein
MQGESLADLMAAKLNIPLGAARLYKAIIEILFGDA